MTILELPVKPRALTAAALRFEDGVNSPELVRQLKRHQAWQVDASGYYSEIGEIHYVVNRAASALSEANLYAATMSETGQLVPVDAPESTVSPSVAAVAMDVLSELRSPVGGQQQLIHQAFVNTEIAGEFFLVETVDDQGQPAWWVRSVLETKIGEPGAPVEIKGVGTVPYDSVSRVWRPHPMRFEAADSGMRPVLAACELIILIDRQFRATLQSRLFAGLLLLPNSFRRGVPDKSQNGDPKADQSVQDMVDALNEAIGDPGSASAVTPNFQYGAVDDINAVRLIEFQKQVDPEVLRLRDSSITRVVQGLEYPPEVVTGTGDVSHWGAWFIGDSFIDHIRPKGNFLTDAFTTVFQRPGMEAQGVSAEDAAKVVLAFDYSPLARKPNIVETATMAHDRYVISDESLRRDLGYDDDDAPTPEEVVERVARRQRPTSEPGVSTGPPSQGPVAAAFTDDDGGQLARIDWDLMERLLGSTVAACRRAAERAGNRAKSRVASAHRDAVRTVEPSQVCAQLGPTLLAAAGVTDDELLDGGFDGLEKDYRRWAEEAAAAALAIALAGVDAPKDAIERWAFQLSLNVDRSWEWLHDSLTHAMSRGLTLGAAPLEAELRALIRQALAACGGVTELVATAPLGAVPVSAVTGIGTGPITLDMLALAGKEVAGWRWVHDAPEHPFPPHVALDGAEVRTADEFAIGFGGWPGDHESCRCVIQPLVRRKETP